MSKTISLNAGCKTVCAQGSTVYLRCTHPSECCHSWNPWALVVKPPWDLWVAKCINCKGIRRKKIKNPLSAIPHPCHTKSCFPKQRSLIPRKSGTLSELKCKGEIKTIPHAGLIFSNDVVHAPFWGGWEVITAINICNSFLYVLHLLTAPQGGCCAWENKNIDYWVV